ncbi:uncharacterized protein G2W53_029200 [Senna tora]|uniref:Uncharacterized protein n=1 Tax=Senna tora TaxID=362788 RepID=A0A834T516_9FABA|nr:uncharacterized protein G2W53_029200 [Senna tora]
MPRLTNLPSDLTLSMVLPPTPLVRSYQFLVLRLIIWENPL